MDRGLADLDNWPLLVSFLPTGWQDEAKVTGALTRARGVSGPDALLRILLIHLASGYSLTETAVRARSAGLGKMTAVAIFKRLRASERWLRWLAKELGRARGWELPRGDPRYRAVDATVISEPGSTGTDWRLHYSLNLGDLQCDFFDVTDVLGGETWRRVPVSPGDVLLGDRIYGTPTGVAHVLRARGEVIARVNHNALPLFELDGSAFPVFRRFRTLRVGKPQQWQTYAVHDGNQLRGRLIAVKRSAEATRRARKRIARRASRRQMKVSQHSWKIAQYFCVWTSLRNQFGPDQILEAYRLRWPNRASFQKDAGLLSDSKRSRIRQVSSLPIQIMKPYIYSR